MSALHARPVDHLFGHAGEDGPGATHFGGGGGARPRGPHETARILLAEPDPYERRLLRLLLADAQPSLIEVEDGQAAIDLLALRSFDLLMISTGLPVMTSLDVVRWIRCCPATWSTIPILGMAPAADRVEANRLMAVGLTDWIARPLSPRVLREKLARLLPALAGRI